VVRRVVRAPPDVVYDEWLDEAALAEFMAPQPFTTAQVECDPRVGGRLRIVMMSPEGMVDVAGEYVELERPSRLSFSWRSSYGGGFDSLVTVTFAPHGGGETLMTITHTRLPPDLVSDHESGWGRIAALVDERLSA
jgi:uncharacterized protein YndB with AHSA1/START domain